MRIARAQLGFAAQAGCADDGTFGHFFQTRVLVGHKRVKRIGAFADGRKRETFRQIHRYVFNRMHGQVGPAVIQSLFQLFDKQAFATDF